MRESEGEMSAGSSQRRSAWLGLASAAVATALLLLPTEGAAVPARVVYTGLLTYEATGAPLAGSVPVQAAVFDEQLGGTAVWTSGDAVVVPLAAGVFSIELGDASNPFDAQVVEGGALWLELTVDGTTMSPRQRVSSVPFALSAADSARLGGVEASDYALLSDLAGVGSVGAIGGDGSVGAPARSCWHLLEAHPAAESGLYWVRPPRHPSPFQVYCDMDHQGGGWTVVGTNDLNGSASHLQLANPQQGIEVNSPVPPSVTASGAVVGEGYIALTHWNDMAPRGELRFVVGANTLHLWGWKLAEGSWQHRWDQADCFGPQASACWGTNAIYNCGFSFRGGNQWVSNSRICFGWSVGQTNSAFAKGDCPVAGHWFGWYGACSSFNLFGNNPAVSQFAPEWMDTDAATAPAYIAIR